MKTLRYTVDIPLEIAATDPAVIAEVVAAQPDIHAPLRRAARHLERAMHRYDQARHTRDEKRALDAVLLLPARSAAPSKTFRRRFDHGSRHHREQAFGITVINGRECMLDGKGQPIPVVNIAPADKLQDELVRKIMAFAVDLSAQITRFRDHTMFDLASFDALLAQEYGAKIGGPKGNRTYKSFDGLMMDQVQIADRVEFGRNCKLPRACSTSASTNGRRTAGRRSRRW